MEQTYGGETEAQAIERIKTASQRVMQEQFDYSFNRTLSPADTLCHLEAAMFLARAAETQGDIETYSKYISYSTYRFEQLEDSKRLAGIKPYASVLIGAAATLGDFAARQVVRDMSVGPYARAVTEVLAQEYLTRGRALGDWLNIFTLPPAQQVDIALAAHNLLPENARAASESLQFIKNFANVAYAQTLTNQLEFEEEAVISRGPRVLKVLTQPYAQSSDLACSFADTVFGMELGYPTVAQLGAVVFESPLLAALFGDRVLHAEHNIAREYPDGLPNQWLRAQRNLKHAAMVYGLPIAEFIKYAGMQEEKAITTKDSNGDAILEKAFKQCLRLGRIDDARQCLARVQSPWPWALLAVEYSDYAATAQGVALSPDDQWLASVFNDAKHHVRPFVESLCNQDLAHARAELFALAENPPKEQDTAYWQFLRAAISKITKHNPQDGKKLCLDIIHRAQRHNDHPTFHYMCALGMSLGSVRAAHVYADAFLHGRAYGFSSHRLYAAVSIAKHAQHLRP